MKKNFKKLSAILMAIVMVLAMSTSVFAASNKTVNVQVKLYGEVYNSQTISENDIRAHLTGNKAHLYNLPQNTDVKLDAADALIQAWYQMYNSSSYTPDQISYGWDSKPVVGEPGMYFVNYDGIGPDPGKYYFVGMNNGEYEYYWQGDSWTLYIDGILADKYASSYDFDSINNIEFDYNTTKSDNFTTKDPIKGAEPAPAK